MPFHLTILGTSSALPTSNRYPTAQVLNVLGRFFLIDCGEGTQMQMRKYKISISRIDHILISHLHGDHIFGLIGLLSTMNLLGRKKDLHIYAHSELQRFLQFQLDFLYPADPIPFKLVFHPLNFKKEQIIFEDKRLTIKSFPLNHRIATCGFRFDERPPLPNLIKEQIQHFKIPIREMQRIKEGSDFTTETGEVIPNNLLVHPQKPGRSYAFCSDTAFLETIAENVRNVDLLYHEATFAEDNRALATATYHSTGKDAATIARKAEVKKLLIGHFSARYKDQSAILDEALLIFPDTIIAEEGLTISV